MKNAFQTKGTSRRANAAPFTSAGMDSRFMSRSQCAVPTISIGPKSGSQPPGSVRFLDMMDTVRIGDSGFANGRCSAHRNDRNADPQQRREARRQLVQRVRSNEAPQATML